MAIHYKEFLPFQLDFIAGREGNLELPIKVFWDAENELDHTQFQTIHENVPLSVRFVASEGAVPADSELWIETASFNEVGENRSFSIPISCESRQTHLYSHETNAPGQETFPWRMGHYIVKIHTGSTTYFTGIQVIPNNLTLQQVHEIQNRLESEVEGLCHELILSQRSFAEPEQNEIAERWYYDYAMWILDKKQSIQGFLYAIERKPQDEVHTSYRNSNQVKRQDARTERWSQTSNGMAVNQGLSPGPFTLNRLKDITLDTSANRWMKKIITMWKKELMEVSQLLTSDIITMIQEETLLSQTMQQANNLTLRMERVQNVYQRYRRTSRSQFFIAQNKRNALQKRRLIIVEWVNVLKALIGRFSFFLTQPFVLDVGEIGAKPILKQRDYFRLNELFEESRNLKKDEGSSRLYKKFPRPTWRVYEYFVFFQMLDIFQDLNYMIVEGLPSRMESFHVEGIAEGARVVLENEHGQVHVWFNKLLPYTWEDARRQGESFYLFGEHRWPDLRVDYYVRKGPSTFEFSKHSIVADAKLIKFRHLHNMDGLPTKTQAQLIAYSGIFFQESRRPVVDRVLCLYAGLGEPREAVRHVHPVSFIQLFPDPTDLDDVWGYEELREIMMSWLLEDVGVPVQP
ncbi:hypothetical protein MHI24_23630 [Paenibacillus sp. FSL K6-1096]|uniref:hypothetical protein n=1 Tax=Paenibacillus sp. FSL K6-1096 TaxID=2921460 RepID=UPI0030EBB288